LRAKILNLVGDELFHLFFMSYASTMFALGLQKLRNAVLEKRYAIINLMFFK
jgi:hypothetical protein